LINTEESHEMAASKSGMDPKTARKYRRAGRLPSEMPVAVRGRTRPDPFIEVWDDVQKLFESMRTAKHTVDSVRPQVIGGWECVLLPMRPV
jgi:hypothetical protein